MRRRLFTALLAVALSAACGKDGPMNPGSGGGGGGGGTGGGGGVQLSNGSMSYTIDGTTINATAITVLDTAGILSISAQNGFNVLAVAFVRSGTGTFNFSTNAGLNFVISSNAQPFQAGPGTTRPGTSGTVILTTLTGNRAVGTFECVATSVTGSATRTVTNGRFDVTF
jgi:hypothetical protein